MAPALLEALISCLGQRPGSRSSRQLEREQTHVWSSSATGGVADGTRSANPLASIRTSASSARMSTTSSHPPGKQLPKDSVCFSPLQASMNKSHLRHSVNGPLQHHPCINLDAAAAYGGHGVAILHVTRNSPFAASVPASSPPAQLRLSYDSPSPATVSFMPGPSPQPQSLARLALQPLATPPLPPKQQPRTSPRPTHDQPPQPQPQPKSTPRQHGRQASVADAYGEEDLDDEWAVVLGDLDGMLARRGQPGLGPPERAVAVRRLILLTGTRGMTFALDAALQDVLRHRGVRVRA